MRPQKIQISALQHYSYCPRQCALIQVEQTYDENLYTLRGNRAHERVDREEHKTRHGCTTERALPIWHHQLGLTGRADVVELRRNDDGTIREAYPVEYKHGSRHEAIHDDVQVCAQALCLEEMFGLEVPQGAIFHVSSRRRREVGFDEKLRKRVLETIENVRQMLENHHTPEPVADSRCNKCSLKQSCMPFVIDSSQ